MATTPEGKIKKNTDKMLKELGVWYFKPQSGPYGPSGIPDYICCVRGLIMGIEAKSGPTKKPTALQQQCMNKIVAAGGTCFVVYDDKTIQQVADWVENHLGLWRLDHVGR